MKKKVLYVTNHKFQGNYQTKMNALTENYTGPGFYISHIAHDSWCDLLKERGPCNCDPDISIEEIKPTVLH